MSEPKIFIPILGTAMWGWNIEQSQAYALADVFSELGGKYFDTATNYPIDKNPEHFGKACEWLSEWCTKRSDTNAQIILKFGALYNDGRPDNDLSPENILKISDYGQALFGESLNRLSIHWDNSDDEAQIAKTIEALMNACEDCGIKAGLSGIKHPSLYKQALNANVTKELAIQIKNNPLTSQAYKHYADFHGKADFHAYGLNAGGLKLSGQYSQNSTATIRNADTTTDMSVFENILKKLSEISCPPSDFNELSLLYNYANPDIKGVIIGPSNKKQMNNTMNFIKKIQSLNIEETKFIKEVLRTA